MNESKLPTVVREGEVYFMGMKVRVLHLDNGQRIIPAEDIERLFALLAGVDDDDTAEIVVPAELGGEG